MTPDERLDRYARLAVEVAVNLQPGQFLRISAEPEHLPLVREIGRVAYERGARYVETHYRDMHLRRARVEHAPDRQADVIGVGADQPGAGAHLGARSHRRSGVVVEAPVVVPVESRAHLRWLAGYLAEPAAGSFASSRRIERLTRKPPATPTRPMTVASVAPNQLSTNSATRASVGLPSL